MRDIIDENDKAHKYRNSRVGSPELVKGSREFIFNGRADDLSSNQDKLRSELGTVSSFETVEDVIEVRIVKAELFSTLSRAIESTQQK